MWLITTGPLFSSSSPVMLNGPPQETIALLGMFLSRVSTRAVLLLCCLGIVFVGILRKLHHMLLLPSIWRMCG